ncbi:MAG TPA: hypothetical protein VGO49_15335 [Bradyrhizobium sp.]|nr:hypothetical protein [Bradyrhizobium sp.]
MPLPREISRALALLTLALAKTGLNILPHELQPSPLERIQPDYWLPEYTSDLLDLLHVLGRLIALEDKQADLLERICAGPLRKADELREAGALTHDEQKPVKPKGKSKSKA